MDALGDRIKRYENVYAHKLTPRSCLFIRVDGKAFHTFTRGSERPFDQHVINSMVNAAITTSFEMQGFQLGYVQSDEATFMLTDFQKLDSQGWFGYELNKVVSISASVFTAQFAHFYGFDTDSKQHKIYAYFDSRAFIVPREDAANAFLWRQQDWTRNSLQMLARAHYSHKELDGKNQSQMHEMLYDKGVNWADLPEQHKNGTWIRRGGIASHEEMCYDDVNRLLFPIVNFY